MVNQLTFMADFLFRLNKNIICGMLFILISTSCFGQFTKNTLPEKARDYVLSGKINEAIVTYASPAKNSNDPVWITEYAYALALGGFYDAALIQLDRLWLIEQVPAEVHSFSSQIFALMGYDKLAGEFWKESAQNRTPFWIASKSQLLLQQNRRKSPAVVPMNHEELKAKFKRANELASQNSFFQAIVLFQEITDQYPDEYLPYVGFSITLEKIGALEASVHALEKGISLIGSEAEQQQIRQFMVNRLVAISQKFKATSGSTTLKMQPMNVAEDKGPQMMAYVGGMSTSAATNLNCRFGYFISGKSNTAIDVGMTKTSAGSSSNFGLSMYSREKIFVMGYGIQATIRDGSSAFYAKLSVGLSLMNKKRTASYDIFLDGNMGLAKGAIKTFNMSVGRSMYFGKRK